MTAEPRHDRADVRLSLLPLGVHRLLLFVIGVALVGLDGARLSGIWPCDIACQGGAHYQTLFGMSVIWPAVLAHALLALLAGRDLRLGRSNRWTVRLVLVLLGVSVFYLVIAHDLGLNCTYCQTVHALTVLAVLFIIPLATRPGESLLLPLAGWLVMNALYHHTPIADVVTTTTTATNAMPSAVADRGRTYGDASAPRTLELVIDLTCRHCAEQYRPLMDALKPAITAKHVRVIVRHLVRPSQAASGPAAELALAAAAMNEHAAALEVLLGSNPDAGAAGLQARLAEVVDPKKLDGVLATQRASINALLAEDQQRIGQLGMGPRTPAAALTEGGRITQRWSGELPVAAIVAALDGSL